MARPPNPLDKFHTYTYHFELHASNDWDELKFLQETTSNESTTATSGTGTLLINTRRDAHQTIDNVRFGYFGNAMQPYGNLTLEVMEPGGMTFAQKLETHFRKYRISSPGDEMIFLLKIIFVGNSNTTAAMISPVVIPISLIEMSADFNYLGGKYMLKFVPNIAVLSPHAGNTLAKKLSRSNNTLTLRAKTVKEALRELEKKLNDNYAATYQSDSSNPNNARPLRYVIKYDEKIDGSLDLVNGTSTAPGSDKVLVLSLEQDIRQMIRTILTSSKEVNEMIASNRGKISMELQKGVNLPIIHTQYIPLKTEAILWYGVTFYKGDPPKDLKYSFDYYFAGAGKNVDVMEFEVKFPTLYAWLQQSLDSADRQLDISATGAKEDSAHYCKYIVTRDESKATLDNTKATASPAPVSSGGIAALPAVSKSEATGKIKFPAKAAGASRLAYDTLNEATTAQGPQLTFTIRGHVDILKKCVSSPNADVDLANLELFGATRGMYVQVNVFTKSPDSPQPTPIYFTGFYNVITVEHVFSSGRFIQMLSVMLPDGAVITSPDGAAISKAPPPPPPLVHPVPPLRPAIPDESSSNPIFGDASA